MFKRLLTAVLIVCISVIPAFAVRDDTFSHKVDQVRKIHGKFTFGVIGDNRSGNDIYRKLITAEMGYKPAFIVNTGDMVEAPNSFYWDGFWERSKPVTVPYFLTPGNHDVDDEESEQLCKKESSTPGNDLYYSFTAGNALFVVLDSTIPGQEKRITGAQYEWLRKVLSNSGKKYKFVFLHHPLFPEKGNGHHYGQCLDRNPRDRDRLEELLVSQKVTAVFAGHEHLYKRMTVGGVTHIITGGGGAPLYSKADKGGFYHFVLITVDKDRISGKVIDIDGKVRDDFRL